MHYIESPYYDAFSNMALEEHVFENLPYTDSYFMLWQNRNAIVVGKYQNTVEEINADYVRKHDIAVVRRLSGGGAMYQDMGNLNFTFVVDQSTSHALDFSIFIQPLVQALDKIGIVAVQSGRNDIVIDGKKISGNSQYNKNGRTMHHGTLLFDSNLDTISKALNPKPDKIASKSIKSVRSRVTNIADHISAPMDMANFKQLLRHEMFDANQLTDYVLAKKDFAMVDTLVHEKYGTWDWNWGRSPACNIRKQRRFPFGGVEIAIQVEGGYLKEVYITGDFFGSDEITSLQNCLRGKALEKMALEEALSNVNVSSYISGMDCSTMVEMLLY